MLDTFKVRLKAKSTAAGANLSQKRIDALADRLQKQFPDLSEEKDHDEKIDVIYDAETLKEFGSLDDYQRAKEKREAEKKPEVKDKSEGKKEPEKGEEIPQWAKALQDEIQALRKEKQQTNIAQKVSENEKLKAIPKSFLRGRQIPENDDDIETFADNVVNDYADFKKEIGAGEVRQNGFITGIPLGSSAPKKENGISQDMKAYLEQKKGAVKIN